MYEYRSSNHARHAKPHEGRHSDRRAVFAVYDWLGTLMIALIVLSLALSYAVRMFGVDGDSMLPTLNNGDIVLLAPFDTQYARGDIIVVDRYTDEPLVKRVIAVGGDTIDISDTGEVSINGIVITEDYIQGKTVRNDFVGPVEIPEGYLFVMGDNRTISKDSRMEEIDLVSVKDVVGKAFYCVWPADSSGPVE